MKRKTSPAPRQRARDRELESLLRKAAAHSAADRSVLSRRSAPRRLGRG